MLECIFVKKYLIIILFIEILLGIPLFMSILAQDKPTAVLATVIETKHTENPAPQPVVLGVTSDQQQVPFYTMGSNVIKCHMPDGRVIEASKPDCDNVNHFWDTHKPSNPAPSGGSNNSNSNSGSNNQPTATPTPTPTVTPTATPTPTITPTPTPVVTVDTIDRMPCTSSSCGGYKTFRVTGTNFTPDAVFELTAWGNTYGKNTSINNSPDAMVTGGNGSTEIIMDYYNLPCNPNGYGYQVVFPDGRKVVASSYYALLCSQ